MRIITHDEVRHNVAPSRCRAVRVIVPVLMALTLAACSGETGTSKSENTAVKNSGPDCHLSFDTSGWTDFKDLSDRVDAGENVPKSDFLTYSQLPSVMLWNRSLDKTATSSDRIANWAEGVFWEKMGRRGKQKRTPDRSSYYFNSIYSLENRELIDTRLEELSKLRQCEMDSLNRYWIESENLPDSIILHFLPAKPEIRILDNNVIVDTGVLSAGSVDQFVRNIAALLYRRFQIIDGPNPLEVEGELSVAHSFRVVVNEGVTGWIDKATLLEFSDEHPTLHQVNIVPEDFFHKTQEAIGVMNRQLGKMLDDEADMAKRGRNFAEHMAGMNAYSQTGYGMSAVISARLGEDRLREASRSIPGFLATYQEAALMNPVPAPLPGQPGQILHETVPAMEPEMFTKLHAMLTRVFPDQE